VLPRACAEGDALGLTLGGLETGARAPARRVVSLSRHVRAPAASRVRSAQGLGCTPPQIVATVTVQTLVPVAIGVVVGIQRKVGAVKDEGQRPPRTSLPDRQPCRAAPRSVNELRHDCTSTAGSTDAWHGIA
jgi:hypothetical protein